ncbi:MAG TPA: hypothetical protein VGO93_18275 [Candidatus Xenobia bacterium]
MSTHAYAVPSFSKNHMRLLEGLSLAAMAVFIGFSILIFTHQSLARSMTAYGPLYLVAMAGIYLVFMIPTRRLARWRKYSAVQLDTSRKGFTYAERGENKTLSWRDVKSVQVHLAARRGVVMVRQFELEVPKLRIKVDNEPPKYGLQDIDGLLAEMVERCDSLKYDFTWYYPVCPFCRHHLHGKGACEGCGRPVVFRQQLFRPWDLLKEDTLLVFMLLLLLLLTPHGMVLGGTAIMVFFWLLLLPMVLARPAKLQVMATPQPASV